MGEYIELDGLTYKIGTMESLYYVRYDQMAAWVTSGRARQKGGNLSPHRYLEGDFRFRFPFPDEDTPDNQLGEAALLDYDRGFPVAGGLEVREMVEHERCYATIQGGGAWGVGTTNLSILVGCPQGEDPHPHIEGRGFVEIVAQRPIFEGAPQATPAALWVVVRCPYCRSMARLDLESAHVLAERLQEAGNTETARRVLAGYGVDLESA